MTILKNANYNEIAEALDSLQNSKLRSLEKELNMDNVKRFDTSQTITKLESIYKDLNE